MRKRSLLLQHLADTPGLTSAAVPAVEDAAELAVREINRFADGTRRQVSGGAGAEEIASWSNKAERARRVLAEQASQADRAALALEAEERGRGESAEDLARTQLDKEATYAAAIALIDGMASRARAAVKEAEADAIPGILEALHQEAAARLSELN